MVVQPQIGWRWFRRFAGFTVKGGIAAILVAGVTVFAARIPDQYACLQLINGFSRSALTFDLVDVNAGLDMRDSRAGQSPFGQLSPDGKYAVLVQADRVNTDESNLIIQKNAESAAATTSVVVQKGIADTSSGYGYSNRVRTVRWSPDSSRLAFLWADNSQKIYLTVVNPDGSNKQTAPFSYVSRQTNQSNQYYGGNRGGRGFQAPINWSPDSQYLSVGPVVSAVDNELVLWSADKLERLEPDNKTALRSGAWASAGHQFAAVGARRDGSLQLVLWSPEAAHTVAIPPAPGKEVDSVLWSPNSQYVTLQSHQSCAALEPCAGRWSFDVASSQGNMLAAGLPGSAWTNSSSSLSTPGAPSVAVWTPDGQSWIYLQEKTFQQPELVAYHVATGQAETVASDIVGDLADDMLYVPSPFRRFLPGGVNLPTSAPTQRIVLPTLQDGKIKVELANLDGKNRIMLAENADEILDAQVSFFSTSGSFWSPAGDLAIVAWATGKPGPNRKVHLSWATADGSIQHTLSDMTIDALRQVQVIAANGQRWLGYTAERNDFASVELADVKTGKTFHLLDDLKDVTQWVLTPAPDGKLAALQVGATAARAYGESSLYLVSLDGATLRQVSSNVSGPAQWSPDGSQLAFVQRGATGTPSTAVVVNQQNEQLHSVPLLQAGTSQPRLYRWTKCI